MDLPLRFEDLTRAQYREQQSLDYARWLSCLADTNLPSSACDVFLRKFPRAFSTATVRKALELSTKAATAPGSTTDTTWAGPLVAVKPLADAFVAIARSASLLGRVPGLRYVPFATKIPTETQGGNFAWTGQGATKPVTKLSLSSGVVLDLLKAVGIIALTSEFVRLAAPGSEVALRDTLSAALVAFQDKAFLDPTSAAVVGVKPASVTAGLTPITSTGNLAVDVQALLTAFFTARPGASGEAVLVCNAAHGAAIRALNAGGGVGVPVVVSEAAGATIVAIDGPGVFVADDGVVVDVSREASLQLDSAPDNPPTAATIPTSLWQLNLVGYKIERALNFYATPTSVAILV